MLKENGRKEPATKEELANLKGKRLLCSGCGEYSIITNFQFTDNKCSNCGALLIDSGMSTASKTTGR